MKVFQKKGLKLVSVLLITLFISGLIAGCGGGETTETLSAPVKLGLLVPYTGVFASNGYDLTNGFELYMEEVGWQAGGREIQLIKEDSEMNAQVALQKTRRLVEGEEIDIMTGVVSSTVAYALRDYIVGNQVPFIIANAGAAGLTGEKGSRYIFRVSFANGQYEYPMGDYAYNKLMLRKVVVMAPDYAAGLEKAKGFMDSFKENGGEIIQEIYPKLGTTDYAPYLAQVDKEADAVWVHFSGTDSIKFVNQYADYGLKDKLPLLSSGDLVDESSLPQQGDAAIGIISSHHYSAALDNPQNKEFVANYKDKYDEEPCQFSYQGYLAAKVIVDALEALNGDVNDTEKLLLAIKSVQFNAPGGPFTFHSKTQNVIFNTYIQKTEKIAGKLVNTVIDTIPDADNRWNLTN